jgi:hypothetical protein
MIIASDIDCPVMAAAGRIGRSADALAKAETVATIRGERFRLSEHCDFSGFRLGIDRLLVRQMRRDYEAAPDSCANRVKSLLTLAEETFERIHGERA